MTTYLKDYSHFTNTQDMDDATRRHVIKNWNEMNSTDRAVLGMIRRYSVKYGAAHLKHDTMADKISYGKSQILMRNYNTIAEVKVVILEMCEDVAKRARDANKAGCTISLGIGYSKNAFGGGFQRSRTINEPTNETLKIYAVCKNY